jgi:molybdopterin-guanine dinucleotide biosynthesis protein A
MIVGIFVGGSATRMGGAPKGLLPAVDTGEALVLRSQRLARELGHVPVLVGAGAAYHAALPTLLQLPDQPEGVGPLGGLAALLRYAGDTPAIALACDMPYISAALLTRISAYPNHAAVVAARGQAGFWEPLCARYDSPRVLPALQLALEEGVRSFQTLLRRLAVAELALSDAERRELTDWDAPDDIGN